MRYVIPLSTMTLADAERVGRKAAVLGELRGHGFAVPDGFGVDWRAGIDVLADVAPGDTAAVRARLADAPLPDGLRAELESALAGLGPVQVAVRSSGIDEDTEGKSFAGQYDSVLGVDGVDGVEAALRECWASGYSERLDSYHERDGLMKVGVLVQAMVPAEAAGAAFSVNPVTGDPEESVVSAVTGLGERLMAGEAVADEWTVRAGRAERTSGDADAITGPRAAAVAELAGRCAEYFGAPQDIEWAYAGDDLWLLQSRPITAVGERTEQVPIPVEVPAGFSVRDPRAPDPWTPMQRSIYLPVFDAAAPGVFAFTTGLDISIRSIGGWIYTNTPPDSMAALIGRLERIAVTVEEGRPTALVRQWYEEWKPETVRRLGELRAVPLSELDDAALTAHLGSLTEFFDVLHRRYFRLTGAAIFLNGVLGLLTKQLLDWEPVQALELRGGLSGDHMAAAVGLGDLARLAATKPALRNELGTAPAQAAGRLAEIDGEFAAAFDRYVQQYGHRTLGFDLTEPTLAEQPEILLSLVATQLDAPFDLATEREALQGRVAKALGRARDGLATADPADRERFETAFADATAVGPLRDEKVYLAVCLWALVRYAVLELGSRLVTAGTIAAREDVFCLELSDALAALTDGADRGDTVRLARGQYAWAVANPGPQYRGTPPAPMQREPGTPEPSAAATHIMDIATWAAGLMGGSGADGGADDGALRGVAASAGRYRGPARIVRHSGEFGKVRAGDVLICPETTAQWSVLFPSLGALVADNGSLLSHPAIIAREYGIPAVVAVGDATGTLTDGQLVDVDGSAGVVRAVTGRVGGTP